MFYCLAIDSSLDLSFRYAIAKKWAVTIRRVGRGYSFVSAKPNANPLRPTVSSSKNSTCACAPVEENEKKRHFIQVTESQSWSLTQQYKYHKYTLCFYVCNYWIYVKLCLSSRQIPFEIQIVFDSLQSKQLYLSSWKTWPGSRKGVTLEVSKRRASSTRRRTSAIARPMQHRDTTKGSSEFHRVDSAYCVVLLKLARPHKDQSRKKIALRCQEIAS